MMSIQNVHQVSDPQPTVEEAMAQLGRMLDEMLVDLDTLFKKNGGTMWGGEAISHNVLTVPGQSRGGGRLFGMPAADPARYVATAMMAVSHNNEAIK